MYTRSCWEYRSLVCCMSRSNLFFPCSGSTTIHFYRRKNTNMEGMFQKNSNKINFLNISECRLCQKTGKFKVQSLILKYVYCSLRQNTALWLTVR
jgi:hypothetical protein